MSDKFRIGIAGLGTVGAGVLRLLQENADVHKERSGREIEIVAVSARDKGADRGVDISPYTWVDDPLKMTRMDNVDAIVELIGGETGIASELVDEALKNGKHIITANKALIAHRGYDIAVHADKHNVGVAYEAAVAGGIPAIKMIRQGLAANNIKTVYGILNGTCNYILTQMRRTGQDFPVVLEEAQDMGYAESDPSFDVDGIDTGHKICLLATIAFGVKPDFSALCVRGIRNISSVDIQYADQFNYRIKLLGMAKRNKKGEVFTSVEPCLVPKSLPLAAVEGVYNAVSTVGDYVGKTMMSGRGAGAQPTASAVVADILDLANGVVRPVFGVPVKHLHDANFMNSDLMRARYYVRFLVKDEVGGLAKIASVLRDNNISVESIVQRGQRADKNLSVVIITDQTQRGDMHIARTTLENLDMCIDTPCLMQIIEET